MSERNQGIILPLGEKPLNDNRFVSVTKTNKQKFYQNIYEDPIVCTIDIGSKLSDKSKSDG